MNNKITIIEGPTPTFEAINTEWALAMVEAPMNYEVVTTNLRTLNGQELLERCNDTWAQQETMVLQYRNQVGLERNPDHRRTLRGYGRRAEIGLMGAGKTGADQTGSPPG